jgi:ABC-2 type transport system permease protein
VLFEGLIVTTLLPLAALVYGTAALGAEIEDGTAVYLLAKPVPRSRIVLAKLLAAWALTTATVVPSGVIAGLIGIAGAGNAGGLVPGFGVALVVGSLVYCALFVLLSIATSRALIAGLAYVFIWEGVVNGLFAGTRLLSVRHATLAIADALAGVPTAVFDAKLGIAGGVGLALILTIGGTLLAVRRLERFEIGDTT